ncbi:hypothetical protein RJ55_08273 [Drechmeria coniospora]|nr:hypothetical protein RJ55_08273 [Drechmeria coniospora]
MNGFSDGPWAELSRRIVERGVVVVVSAGNEGQNGPLSSGTGSNGHGVLSVAAINVTGDPDMGSSDPGARPMAAPFTSWGPTNEMLLKPDVGAPGYRIVSTLLRQRFGMADGTSMAAPYVAGVAALYIGKHGGRAVHGPGFAKRMASRIISSGRSVAWCTGHGMPRPALAASPFQVGTGLVNAQKVLESTTDLSFEPFALLDTKRFRPEWTVQIANEGKDPVRYSFELEPQPGVGLNDRLGGINALQTLEPLTLVPNVSLPDPLLVSPGAKASARVVFSPPEHVGDDEAFPLYGGKLWVKGDGGEELCIPYGGAAYDVEKAFDTLLHVKTVIRAEERGWAWSFDTEKDPSDYVDLRADFRYPCYYFRWDIFASGWTERDWTYPPLVGKRGHVGSAAAVQVSSWQRQYRPERHNKSDTVAFPQLRVPRGNAAFWWFGKLADGTQIVAGNYTMRVAALRPHGNPHVSGHWDVMRMEVPSVAILARNGTRSVTATSGARSPN